MDSARAEVPVIPGFSGLVEIGHGGFSTVYRATQDHLHRPVAIKVLSAGNDTARRFRREASALGALSEIPHVVPVHQVTSTTDGRAAFVMPLLDRSLAGLTATYGRIRPEQVATWLDQLAGAIDRAHQIGILHRDIKPANILIDHRDDAYLADFGIATIDSTPTGTETARSISPPHAPPERLAGDLTPTRESDVYSLASTVYEALVGAPPFGTSNEGGVAGLSSRVLAGQYPPVAALSPAANAVLARGLATNAADRWPSATEFARAFRAALADPAPAPAGASSTSGVTTVIRPQPIGIPTNAAPPHEEPSPWTAGRIAGAAAAVGLLVIAIVVAFATLGSGSEGQRGANARPADASLAPRAEGTGDDGSSTDSIPELGGVTANDCVTAGAAFGSITAGLAGQQLTPEQQEQIEAARDSLPDEIRDDYDLMAEAFDKVADTDIVAAGEALASPEFEAAQKNVEAYVEDVCGGSGG